MLSEKKKLLSIWPQELAHLKQITHQRAAFKIIAQKASAVLATSTQNFPTLKGKGERRLILSPFSHRWIKEHAFTLSAGCNYLIHLYD